MIYTWRPGLGRQADPQAIGEAIEDIAARNGGVASPRMLADEARAEDHAFHPLLEWDDEKAATEHRVHQTRGVIRSVRIIRDGDDGGAESGPAFVHVKPSNAPEGYQRIDEAMASSEVRAAVVKEAMQQLDGFKRRYQHLTEFRPVFDAADSLDV